MRLSTSSLRPGCRGLQRLVIIDHADVIDPDDSRVALGDKTLYAPSQSLVAALKSRAVVLVLTVCTENLIRVADVMESPKLAE